MLWVENHEVGEYAIFEFNSVSISFLGSLCYEYQFRLILKEELITKRKMSHLDWRKLGNAQLRF